MEQEQMSLNAWIDRGLRKGETLREKYLSRPSGSASGEAEQLSATGKKRSEADVA